MKRRGVLAVGAALLCCGAAGYPAPAQAAEVHVMISGGFTAAYKELVPEFEKSTGNKVSTAFGPSMGTTPTAIPVRLARGEPADVLIMVGYALDGLVKDGRVAGDSKVDLARSLIALAVKDGAPKPDITTLDAFKKTLLNAKSIAYSDSASGVYIEKEMYAKLGLADQLHAKSRMIPAEPVGGVVARGDAEIGFQQLAELKPVPGIVIVGMIPPEVQQVTIFSAGVPTASKEPAAAKALIAYLSSATAAPVVKNSGLEPIAR